MDPRRAPLIDKPIISADSHVIEPPSLFVDRIDKKYKDRAPRMIRDETRGDVYHIDGLARAVGIGSLGSAGKSPQEKGRVSKYALFEEQFQAAWDGKERTAAQDVDGVAAEVLYPSIGMVLFNNPDLHYKSACFEAYNDWMQEFSSANPDRLLGIGLTAVRTSEDGVKDLEKIKRLGLRGVAIPAMPGVEDYDHEMYDDFWAASIELGLPVSTHIYIGSQPKARGSMLNFAISIIRHNQDLLSLLIFGGVFRRHPKLKVVCVEADAGWVPHYAYRMDHMYKNHRFQWDTGRALEKLPSEQFSENIYLTFQDDFSVMKMMDMVNPRRLLWANDFPHSDSTWPESQKLIAENMSGLTQQQRTWILHDNVCELYGISDANLRPRTKGPEPAKGAH